MDVLQNQSQPIDGFCCGMWDRPVEWKICLCIGKPGPADDKFHKGGTGWINENFI